MSNLDQYNRYPDPPEHGRRGVPFMTQLAVAFGGYLLQGSAGLFTLGMVFWWLFGAQADATSWYKFAGDLALVDGTAVGSYDTGFSDGRGEYAPATPIYRIEYQFISSEGEYVYGTSYATGMHYSSGESVLVEYVADDPATSRIVFTRKAAFDEWGLIVAIFPGFGLIGIAVGFRRNLRALRVLKIGKCVRGRAVNKQATANRVNNKTVYKFTFEYDDDHGITHRLTANTHHVRLLEDDETERLVYDPSNPSFGMLLDVLPGKPKVLESGHIGPVSPHAAVLRVVLPVGGIVVHTLVGLIHYTG